MKKQYRLTSSDDFTSVIKKGFVVKSKSATIYALSNNLTYVRIGVSAPTKLGNAVVRTTTRRKLRAILDQLIDYNKYNLDIVVVAKNDFLNTSFQNNVEDIKTLLKQIPGFKNEKKN